MYICDLPRSLILNNIFANINENENKHEPGNESSYMLICIDDSYFYQKKNKIIDFNNEVNKIASFQHVNITLFIERLNPYFTMNDFFPNEELTYNQLEIYEILKYIKFSQYYFFKPELIVCNLSDNNEIIKKNVLKFRPNSHDIIENFELNYENIDLMFMSNSLKHLIDLFYIDLAKIPNSYDERNRLIIFLIKIITMYQNKNGVLIIKVTNIETDHIIQEFIFLISGWYATSFIYKPTIMNPFNEEVYIVFKEFNITDINKYKINLQLYPLIDNCLNNKCYTPKKLLSKNVSRMFKDMIKENRIVNGQIYLEFIEYLVGIFKNKNREEKLIWFQQNNLLKCESWYDKHVLH